MVQNANIIYNHKSQKRGILFIWTITVSIKSDRGVKMSWIYCVGGVICTINSVNNEKWNLSVLINVAVRFVWAFKTKI